MAMRTLLAVLLGLALSAGATAKSGEMMAFEPNLSDQKSLQRGAALFVNYCVSCHSASYMRFNRLGRDLGITEEVLKKNFMFGTDKPGETMTVAMNPADGEKWFGVAPPDLSVTARARGAEWLYTYFMTFYRDPSRPTGVNNLAFKDVAMPHVLWQRQGWQRAVFRDEENAAGEVIKVFDSFEMQSPGTRTPAEYAADVRDLVNFMVYLGEPVKLKRFAIGGWVLAYLFVLLLVVVLLKREYWRDVH
jgi:ubiquinol-cytochrome c reductase cytochrome c1 subunit